MTTDCVFCRIISGDEPATMVYQDGEAVGIVPLTGQGSVSHVHGQGDAVTLHEDIKAAVERRLAAARAATPGPWAARTGYPQCVVSPLWREGEPEDSPYVWLISTTLTDKPDVDAEFIAANGPDRIIRDCQRDLKTLARHVPTGLESYASGRPDDCMSCSERMPCDEICDLADDYDI